MSTQPLLIAKQNGIATLTLNRPEVGNALNQTLIFSCTEALEQCAQDPDTRVLLLRGQGKYFCTGADLQEMQDPESLSSRTLAHLLHSLYTFPKPTIALIQAGAFGGGMGLLACCDIAIATQQAVFCFSEVRLGLAPAIIAPYIVAAIGIRFARQYLLTAETFDATTACNMQLVHKLTDTEENLSILGQEYAEKISNNDSAALTVTKSILQKSYTAGITARLIEETIPILDSLRQRKTTQAQLIQFLKK